MDRRTRQSSNNNLPTVPKIPRAKKAVTTMSGMMCTVEMGASSRLKSNVTDQIQNGRELQGERYACCATKRNKLGVPRTVASSAVIMSSPTTKP